MSEVDERMVAATRAYVAALRDIFDAMWPGALTDKTLTYIGIDLLEAGHGLGPEPVVQEVVAVVPGPVVELGTFRGRRLVFWRDPEGRGFVTAWGANGVDSSSGDLLGASRFRNMADDYLGEAYRRAVVSGLVSEVQA